MKFIVVCNFLLALTVSAASPVDSPPVRIGLALSGGAALGIAHIGVLKVLEQEGIPVCYISGNSIGSMVGGVYAAGYRVAEIESIATHVDWSTLFSSNAPFGAQYLPERQQSQRYVFQLRHRNLFPALPSGLVPLQNVEFLLMELLSEIEYNTYYDFDSLPTPYRAIAVDLIKGNKVILRRGRLEQAIRASIAIPGVFAPEELDGQELVDGGVQQYLPVDPLLEFQPDFIIAVLTMKHSPETGISLIDVVSRSMDVMSIEDLNRQKQLANVLIEPNVDPFRHSDFARARELIAAGEAAARAALPEIYAKLAGRKTVALRRSVESRALSVVRSVQLEGLRVTHQQLIRNEMKTRPGDYLRFNRLLSDLTRIFNTGLFEDVNYRLEFGQADSVDPVRNFGDSSILLEPSSYNYSPSGISNEVDIIIELQERAYGFYSLGIRYDNIDNVGLGIEVGQGNLLGSGASIRGVIDWGNPNEYRLGLTGTRLFRLPFGYRLDAFWGSRDRSYYENGNWRGDYNADQRGGLAEAGYILGHDAYFNIGINAYEALYRMPDPPFFEIFPKREWIIGPTFHMEFNNFNDLYLPARGRTYRLAGFYSSRKLKSSNDFLKFCLSYERIISVSDRFLLRPGIELGVSWGKLAWSEYFHTGGENLAGFTKNEFTTDQKAIFHLGTDFRLFQLFNHEGYPFYLQLFSNIATFQKLSKLVGVVNFDSILNWGVGIGVRTNTPIGPFQLILGFADFGKSSQYAPNRINIFISVGKDFRYSQD